MRHIISGVFLFPIIALIIYLFVRAYELKYNPRIPFYPWFDIIIVLVIVILTFIIVKYHFEELNMRLRNKKHHLKFWKEVKEFLYLFHGRHLWKLIKIILLFIVPFLFFYYPFYSRLFCFKHDLQFFCNMPSFYKFLLFQKPIYVFLILILFYFVIIFLLYKTAPKEKKL